MKILMLTPQLPYPPQQGTSLRNYHVIRGLSVHHQVTLLSFLEVEQTADPAAIAPLSQLCTYIETIPAPTRTSYQRLKQLLITRLPDMAHRLYSPMFNVALRRLLTETDFDIVQVEGIELARTIEIIRVTSRARIVFDNHNAETELQRRNFLTDLRTPSRWLAAVYSWLQIGRLRRFEQWACQMADAVTVVSQPDQHNLEFLIGSHSSPITAIPNCLDVFEISQASEKQDTALQYDLVFSGKMDYRPNVDAVLWFVEQIWPLVLQKRPNSTLVIVGQKPHPRLERLQSQTGITLTGWVENVQPYLTGAKVFVMPFRIGSGTRLKLIEAMAAGKAIVSTPVGIEGFPARHGQELLLAETAKEFATAVLYLLNHADEREKLGSTARQFAQQYDWRVVIPRFNSVYESLTKKTS